MLLDDQITVDNVPEHLRCRYTSKKCYNQRTKKTRGQGLHALCAMHQAHANRNQRRVDKRRRQRNSLQMERTHKYKPIKIQSTSPIAKLQAKNINYATSSFNMHSLDHISDVDVLLYFLGESPATDISIIV